MKDIQVCRWHIFSRKGELLTDLRVHLLKAASEAIEKNGVFRMVLAGGETPLALYNTLIEAKTDWKAWHIYFGDERCLPQGDGQRNDEMAKRAWLNHVPIPSDQIHSIPTELGSKEGAETYHNILKKIAAFDLVLLGLGEDGHTASLFSESKVIYKTGTTVAIVNAPKPPTERVSMGAEILSETTELFFIVTGKNKQNAVQRWRNGESIPASAVKPNNGVDVFLDHYAWKTGKDLFGKYSSGIGNVSSKRKELIKQKVQNKRK